jgi:hypothetical protein
MSEYSSKLRLCNGKSLAAANGKVLPLGCLSARGVILIPSIARISLNTTATTTSLPGLALRYWMTSCSASFALLTLRRCLRTRPLYQPLGEQLRVFAARPSIAARISALCSCSPSSFPIAALEPVSHTRIRVGQKGPALVRALRYPGSIWSKCHQTRLIPGGCHVPLPGGRIEGASVFGQ